MRKPARIVIDPRGKETVVSGASRNARGVHYLVNSLRVKRKGVDKAAYRAAIGQAIAELMGEVK